MFKKNQINKLGVSLGLGIILTLIGGINVSTLAQSQYEEENGYQSNEKNGVFGDAPSGLDPVDLMHRAQQAGGRTPAEFEAEYQGQLNNSVSDFKRLQQQRILEQKKPATNTEPTPKSFGE
jgi:hypothetical protein